MTISWLRVLATVLTGLFAGFLLAVLVLELSLRLYGAEVYAQAQQIALIALPGLASALLIPAILVLAALVMLIGEGVAPAWMVALIVVREILVSGLRLAAVERGVVLGARDLGRVKTWAQALAAAIAGFAAAGAWSEDVAWWALLAAVVATWVSGLDYARVAPRVLRGEGA